jgi:hypothetical protein
MSSCARQKAANSAMRIEVTLMLNGLAVPSRDGSPPDADL